MAMLGGEGSQSRSELASSEDLKAIVREDVMGQEGQKFFIDSEVFNRCYQEIWKWLSVESLGPHLLKRKLMGDVTGLQELRNPYHTPRDRTDRLLRFANEGGPYGYHVLYMCIRDDDENPRGHRSAVDVLRETALSLGKTPPTSLVPTTLSIQEVHVETDNDDDELRGQSMPAQPNATPTTINTTPPSGRPSIGSASYSVSPIHETRQWPQTHPPTNVVRPNSLEADSGNTNRTTTTTITTTTTTISPMAATATTNLATTTTSNVTNGGAVYNGKIPHMARCGAGIDMATNSNSSPPRPTCDSRHNTQPTAIIEKVCHMLEKNDQALEDELSHTHKTDAHLCADHEDLDELLEDVVQFVVACLNSRASNMAAGVLVAGAESLAHGYCTRGLKFPLPIEMYDLIKEKLRNLVSCKSSSDSTLRPVNADEIMKMVTPAACTLNFQDKQKQVPVLIIAVQPQVAICKDELYFVKCGKRQQVYRRLDGGTNHVTGRQVLELHRKLEETFCMCKMQDSKLQ